MFSSRSTLSRTKSFSTMNANRTPVPGSSRARPKSPGPAAKDESTVTKLGPIPSLKDTGLLIRMMEKILSVLSALGYPKVVQPAAFRSLGGNDLQKMFSFLLRIMVGPNNGKDESTYLSESLDMLGCPVMTLKTSSQLKTLSLPHVLPFTITALCWLACYVDEFMGLQTEGFTPDDENNNNHNEKVDLMENLSLDPRRVQLLNVIAGQNETLEIERNRLVELEMKLDKFTYLIPARQFSVAYWESRLAFQHQLKEAIKVFAYLTSERQARKKYLTQLEQANKANGNLIEELTAKVMDTDAKVERLKLNKLTEVEAQEYLLAFVTEAISKGDANLAKLCDPEFRRKVLAKRSGSKNGGRSHSTNALGRSEKDSGEAE